YVGKIKFLGIGYYVYKGEARIKVHKKSIEKMKSKIREITSRRTSISHELRASKLKRYVIGWVNYFKIAYMINLLKTIDSWLRRRLRQIYWKQWKKTKTKFERLTKLGVEKSKAWEYANTRKGYWRISKSPILHRTLKTQTLRNEGYLFFTDYYKSI
ncbi:MAG: group II intron reverse transcriptase/maturase, partial [Defluviitaleaceae bacterium]|nr:group II intron reverse transcriptase/maturase [Defluviitaleaceae bacterium]